MTGVQTCALPIYYNVRNGTNIQPELIVLTGEIVDPHSVLKVGDRYIDLNFSEAYPASDYMREYDNARNLGHVKSKNIRGALTAHGYTYK